MGEGEFSAVVVVVVVVDVVDGRVGGGRSGDMGRGEEGRATVANSDPRAGSGGRGCEEHGSGREGVMGGRRDRRGGVSGGQCGVLDE